MHPFFLQFTTCRDYLMFLNNSLLTLLNRLKTEYTESTASIRSSMLKSKDGVKKMCVSLKVLGGPHLGQKFRFVSAISFFLSFFLSFLFVYSFKESSLTSIHFIYPYLMVSD